MVNVSTRDRITKIIQKVEEVAVSTLQLLVALLVAIATVVLCVIFAKRLLNEINQVESIETFLPVMQNSFAGILTVVLALELLETLKAYYNEHHIRLEVILIVATIAAARHVLEINFDHSSGVQLLGFSAVILSLTLGYFLVTKTQTVPEESKREPPVADQR
jgi:uncharacterized membrane protein (DUF373 family)